jgi:hypothetical protein
VSGCTNFYNQAKASYPGCAQEIDSVFDCTGQVPVASIQCNPSSPSPTYAPGVCSAENAALTACTAGGSGSCNTVPLIPATVTGAAATVPVPAMTGGTIADGTYVETTVLAYSTSTPTLNTQQETLVFSGTRMDSVSVTDGGAEERYTATVSTPGGSEISFQITCTSPNHSGLITTAYTATATELQVIWETNVVHTYARQ